MKLIFFYGKHKKRIRTELQESYEAGLRAGFNLGKIEGRADARGMGTILGAQISEIVQRKGWR